jgi:beta-N-acetylhexosaminidase
MNMQTISLLFSFLLLAIVTACSQAPDGITQPVVPKVPKINSTKVFTLEDYLSENKDLTLAVDDIFKQLDDTAIVAQVLMPAVGKHGHARETIAQHINSRLIGGILMLNGTKDEFTQMIKDFNKSNISKGNLPFLYSADAEPSLVNRKITGSAPVKKAAEITTLDELILVTESISKDLNDIGINYNFAPVVDVAGNATVGYRGFGNNPTQLIPWSNTFIQETQKKKIIATAKHFPGHGLVEGDTHTSLQTIDGELKEISNYPELIKNGVLSIMVAHIAVKNNPKYNTEGLPSTCSPKIVTDLLQNELKFKGLIVTDAMNMGGVVNVPNCATKAIQAGCHIVLMPVDAKKAHEELLIAYRNDKAFKNQLDEAAKKVIRMKICLGLLNQDK